MSTQERVFNFLRENVFLGNSDVQTEVVTWIAIIVLSLIAFLFIKFLRQRETRSRKKMIEHLDWRPEVRARSARSRRRSKAAGQ